MALPTVEETLQRGLADAERIMQQDRDQVLLWGERLMRSLGREGVTVEKLWAGAYDPPAVNNGLPPAASAAVAPSTLNPDR